jgi:hypothetical protein
MELNPEATEKKEEPMQAEMIDPFPDNPWLALE